MNSVLWDINRWGPNFQNDYKNNLKKLLQCVKSVLADDGMFIWLTAQPGYYPQFLNFKLTNMKCFLSAS